LREPSAQPSRPARRAMTVIIPALLRFRLRGNGRIHFARWKAAALKLWDDAKGPPAEGGILDDGIKVPLREVFDGNQR